MWSFDSRTLAFVSKFFQSKSIIKLKTFDSKVFNFDFNKIIHSRTNVHTSKSISKSNTFDTQGSDFLFLAFFKLSIRFWPSNVEINFDSKQFFNLQQTISISISKTPCIETWYSITLQLFIVKIDNSLFKSKPGYHNLLWFQSRELYIFNHPLFYHTYKIRNPFILKTRHRILIFIIEDSTSKPSLQTSSVNCSETYSIIRTFASCETQLTEWSMFLHSYDFELMTDARKKISRNTCIGSTLNSVLNVLGFN